MTREEYVKAALSTDAPFRNLPLFFKNENSFLNQIRVNPAAAALKAHDAITRFLWTVAQFAALYILFIKFIYPSQGFEKTIIILILGLTVKILWMKK